MSPGKNVPVWGNRTTKLSEHSHPMGVMVFKPLQLPPLGSWSHVVSLLATYPYKVFPLNWHVSCPFKDHPNVLSSQKFLYCVLCIIQPVDSMSGLPFGKSFIVKWDGILACVVIYSCGSGTQETHTWWCWLRLRGQKSQIRAQKRC